MEGIMDRSSTLLISTKFKSALIVDFLLYLHNLKKYGIIELTLNRVQIF